MQRSCCFLVISGGYADQSFGVSMTVKLFIVLTVAILYLYKTAV